MLRPRRLLSHTIYFLMKIPLPPYLRTMIYRQFGNTFDLIFDDMENPDLESYLTFNDFFTRAVKKRTMPQVKNALISPADSKILSIQKITENDVILAKKVKYSLSHFLTGKFGSRYSKNQVEGLKVNKGNELYSIVFYLNPGDYHRYHSMADTVLKKRVHVAGELYTVKDTFVSKFTGVYEVNERVIVEGLWAHGKIFQVYVAATNVGVMDLTFDPDLNTNSFFFEKIINPKQLGDIRMNVGQEMGRFNMGSTVVAVVEVPRGFEFDVKVGQKIRYGDLLGK